jgi:hypothetical protein
MAELPEDHPFKQVQRQIRQFHERRLERTLIAEERSDLARREQEGGGGKIGRPLTNISHWTEAIKDLNETLAKNEAGSLLHLYRAARARHMLRFLRKQPGFQAPPARSKAEARFLRLLRDRLAQEEKTENS